MKRAQALEQALEKSFLFSSLEPSQRTALGQLFVPMDYQKGESLFLQGQAGEHLLLLVGGQVRIEREVLSGRSVTLTLRGPGDVLGEMALIDGHPRSASAYAIENCQTMVLGRERLYEFLRSHPELYPALLVTLCQRLRQSDRKFEELAVKSIRQRLAGLFLELADNEGEDTAAGIELSSKVNFELLSGLLCTNRESVSRTVRELRNDQLLDKNGRRFVLLDLQGLARAAGWEEEARS